MSDLFSECAIRDRILQEPPDPFGEKWFEGLRRGLRKDDRIFSGVRVKEFALSLKDLTGCLISSVLRSAICFGSV